MKLTTSNNTTNNTTNNEKPSYSYPIVFLLIIVLMMVLNIDHSNKYETKQVKDKAVEESDVSSVQVYYVSLGQ
jgi:hypothetical protein